MYTTTQTDNGVINNYAREPKMTYASMPDFYQQRRYLKQGAIAALFVSLVVFMSFLVS
ncbi:ssl1498 family light-harvesting-like protein [Waterburya agarophytonicola K14]|uniref:Ssl1498 family light-harvesting-like protein n=1 Tax=Waterburya agarophytonicola KI4 TaxID=2874699 RepID=A0A964BTM0_9CYAN|nr:ssl1498 family light-harvesting-like protein [Waterburya agarophytonicola]MCC0178492.1 ssl1498 family light-harvesting-like protein [Waterburya agarophytonicola KI4]